MDPNAFLYYFNQQFAIAGNSAWDAIYVAVIHGGWMVLFYFFFMLLVHLYHDVMIGNFVNAIKFNYLAITIPKMNEQTPRAVENFFNHLAGGHVTQDLIEKYWLGEYQPWFSFEILSVEGYIQFLIYSPVKYRDLTEASLYAQYPDAQITDVEDPFKDLPTDYPNEGWNAWGTEFTLAMPEAYPILSYKEFEHSVSKLYFKDPLAALLETMSRIGKGEYFGFQMYASPTDKKWQKGVFALAGQLTADLVKHRATTERPFPVLHKGEMKLVEDVHAKATKVGFKCKLRVIYVARKENYNAKRVQYGVVGFMKQFSRDDANGLKPLYSLTGVTGHYAFKDFQKEKRKTAIVTAFKRRSGTRGGAKFILNVEEMATLWHFPLAHAVRAPALDTASAKRSEAPGRLPLETEFMEDAPVFMPEAPIKIGKHEKKTHEPPHNLPIG